jgi:hypothetical protein
MTVSPIRENARAVAFLLGLLIVAGVTATIVGYRVKSADWERKAQLLTTYERLGGSFKTLMTPGVSLLAPQQGGPQDGSQRVFTEPQRGFVAVYELNQRAREYGLINVLETTNKESLDRAVSTLSEIGASEAARTVSDARSALTEPVAADGLPMAVSKGSSGSQSAPTTAAPRAKAQRFAKQYGRPMARETEVKLYGYLSSHPEWIAVN